MSIKNPLAFSGPITVDTLDQLFNHHRSLTGGWSMTAGPGESEPPKDEPPAFNAITTQADLDRIVGARLAREREKFADYDQLKTKAAEYDKAIEAAKTEQEKAVEAAKTEGRTEALTTANARLVAAEARALAAEAKFRNPQLAVRAVDLSGVTVSDDGTVDADAIKSKLKELSDAEPYLVDDGKKFVPRPDPSQGGGGSEDGPSLSRGRDLYAARRGKKTA